MNDLIHSQIAACALFEGFAPAALADLARGAAPQHIAEQGFIFHQDAPAEACYLLLRGQVRLTKLADTGQQVIIRVAHPPDVMGIIAALPGAIYPLSAQAISPCDVVSWDHAYLNQFMERYPLLALRALRLVAHRFTELQDQYLELATERVERRIARALLRLVNHAGKRAPNGVLIDMPLSRQDLAELTGTTLYTVSRTLSRWEQQGLIESGRERVLVLNPHQLVVIADDLPDALPPDPR